MSIDFNTVKLIPKILKGRLLKKKKINKNKDYVLLTIPKNRYRYVDSKL